jgi:ribose 5-phosphate isomerase B
MKNPPVKKNIKKNLPKNSPQVYLASDHAGFILKKFLIEKIIKLGFEPIDLGCDSSEKSVDYPDYAQKLCKKITKTNNGILICGSGIGISIAANRFKNIRAALCHDVKSAKASRAHNDANVLCLGARVITNKMALTIVKAFFSTEFEGERHAARIKKLSK